ncbi:SPFH domain-containing protein [Mucilaginibacter sp. KACC 22063]|uniref:SPFH domain-containing protein n=1 Tax=Mucilaginibacter sp. KACC 22063 TaxID=3025666 RepID=UPI0023662447|nr:SPFH domain-containing protein [Mucilaginibacter sp. KACC 22063]WDF55449.1 SPFH domain-containing protein [Mucilaginibacter sp. KACC 22063]
MSALMEVLEFLDDSGSVMVKRLPDAGPAEIKWGAQLTVRETQEAIFFRDGQIVDVFTTGRHLLETKNIPGIGKWVTSFAYGPDSPFRAEVYFVSKKIFVNLKWGTQEPILFKDAELQMVRLRSFGIFSVQIADSRSFVNQIVGTMGLYRDEDIADYLKNIIVSKLTVVLAAKIKTILDMPGSFAEISDAAKLSIQNDFANIGLSLHDFYVNSVSVPEEVQQMIDERSRMSAVGNMDQFMKYKLAMSIEDSAQNVNASAGANLNAGLGMGMGFMMPQMVQQAMASVVAPAQASATAGPSPVQKLKEIKELLDMGVLTQAEFDEKKAKLLEQI